ncbi:retrovirus-related pol polyprotein from transposon [Plakobranchus ocellatus]|uniref:Retrovirus-related pol polyprotein from transposon n=1 Tax=Plakobranchus ocellatus TaxID=259542 RepID=A0AAV4CW17_9GAST|nr:retrovirus-related pol polyprotein from transposon [Plakobranchus ocellatus]
MVPENICVGTAYELSGDGLNREAEDMHKRNPAISSCQFRPYLLGHHFKERTDNNSLRWLTSFKEPQGQLARWLEELSQYDMEIIHRPGKHHGNADALSRIPPVEECPSYNASSLLTNTARGCSGAGASSRKKWMMSFPYPV